MPVDKQSSMQHDTVTPCKRCLLVFAQVAGVLAQLGGTFMLYFIVVFGVLDGNIVEQLLFLIILVCTLLLSVIWTRKVQQFFVIPQLNSSKETSAQQTNARWKASEFSTLSINFTI